MNASCNGSVVQRLMDEDDDDDVRLGYGKEAKQGWWGGGIAWVLEIAMDGAGRWARLGLGGTPLTTTVIKVRGPESYHSFQSEGQGIRKGDLRI